MELDSERAWVWFRRFPGFIKRRGIPVDTMDVESNAPRNPTRVSMEVSN